MVTFKDVFYVYNKKTPLEHEALSGISLLIKEGSFTGLVGKTGSGKSTLVQQINALLTPSSGSVTVNGFVNEAKRKHKGKEIRELRRNVGLVFQFPENQLFEESVEKDVAFAPKNFGISEKEALALAHDSLKKVGLGEEFYSRSPFDLSGGEKRRVAIAGVLAFKPKILIVDEPTSGLDPWGSKEIMELFRKVHEEGTTIILVTHDMSLVQEYCDEVIVMDKGKVALSCKPSELFALDLEPYSLEMPPLYRLMNVLKKKGAPIDCLNIRSLAELSASIAKLRSERK
jgi:energy-coupling factor transport system ATP-binding protein